MTEFLPYIYCLELTRPWWKFWERSASTVLRIDARFIWDAYLLAATPGAHSLEVFVDGSLALLPVSPEFGKPCPLAVTWTLAEGAEVKISAGFVWWRPSRVHFSLRGRKVGV